MPFAQQLKLLRERAGLSQKELGVKLGVKQQTIGHWESGIRDGPKPDELLRLCEILGVTCSELLEAPKSKTKKKK